MNAHKNFKEDLISPWTWKQIHVPELTHCQGLVYAQTDHWRDCHVHLLLSPWICIQEHLASYEGSDDDISTMLSSSTSGTESIATPTAPLLEDEEDRRAIMDLLVELLHDNK